MYNGLIADSATFFDLFTKDLVISCLGIVPIAVAEVVFSWDSCPIDINKQKKLKAAGLKFLNSELDLEGLRSLKLANPGVRIVDCITLQEAGRNPNSIVLTDDRWILEAANKEKVQTLSFNDLCRKLESEHRPLKRVTRAILRRQTSPG